MSDKISLAPYSELTIFTSEDGSVRVECHFESQTLWLSQAGMAELYGKDVRTISEHLNNIYDEEELHKDSTLRKFRIVRQEGNREVSRETDHYTKRANYYTFAYLRR